MVELPVDLLALRDAPLSDLVAAIARVADAGGPADALDGLSEISVDEVVRLVRAGDATEMVEGGRTLTRFLGSPRGRAACELAPAAHERLAGLVSVLTAAISPSSKGGDALVLRSWNGKAEEALGCLAARHGAMPRAELRGELNVSESYISHLLRDLEGAGLVERIGIPGRRGVEVHLTAEGRDLAPEREAVAVAPEPVAAEEAQPEPVLAKVIQLRPAFVSAEAVPRPGNELLLQRLENMEERGGPSAHLPLATFA
jgi:DNA-binding MarR family transcriptional regulator